MDSVARQACLKRVQKHAAAYPDYLQLLLNWKKIKKHDCGGLGKQALPHTPVCHRVFLRDRGSAPADMRSLAVHIWKHLGHLPICKNTLSNRSSPSSHQRRGAAYIYPLCKPD